MLVQLCKALLRAPRPGTTARAALVGLMAGIGVLAAPLAQAVAAEQAELLQPGASGPAIDLPEHALASAARAGRFNPAALHAQRIRIALPDGRVATAEREREITRSAGSISWIGHFDDEPGSVLVLTSHRGAVTGSILYGPARYELQPQRTGGHVLFKVDESRVAPDVVLAPPQPITAAAPPETVEALPNIEPYASSSPGYIHDLLVVYTQAARVRWGQATLESRILSAVELANQAYRNSQVNILLHLTGMVEISYAETGDMAVSLERLRITNDNHMDNVHTLRNNYGADLVSLVDEDTNVGGSGACGIAYIMKPEGSSFAAAAFSVVPSGCLSGGALAHEIGHNQGDAHDRATVAAGGEVGGAFDYSYGFRRCINDGTGFRTLMAYPSGCSGGNFVAYFSNPDVLVNGFPAGIDFEADPGNSADNSRSMNNTADTVAAFRAGAGNAVPIEPTGLGASASSSSQINLAWSDNANNESGYRVERSANGTSFTEIAVLAANSVTYSSTGLTAATTYWYRVRAYNSKGNSGYSNVASVQTTALQPPAAPSNLQASVLSTTSVGLTWIDNASNETGFTIQRSSDSAATWTASGTPAANATSFTVTGLQAGIQYYFRIRATNGDGNSAWSNLASATTVTMPASPGNLAASATSASTVDLAWTDNSNNESQFIIQKAATSGDLNWSDTGTTSPNVTAYTVTGLNAATEYRFRVRAANAAGTSDPSNTVTAFTQSLPGAPASPSGLQANSWSPTTVSLQWADNSANETGFTIYFSTGSGWSSAGNAPAGTTSFTHQGRTPVTNYSYRVVATNALGNSTPSNTAAVTTLAALPPATPSGLLASASSATSVALAWLDNADNEDDFEIQYSDNGGLGWNALAIVAANSTSYTDTGLAAATTRSYRLRARNAIGVSPFSNEADATTPDPLAAPTDLAATAQSADAIRLTWTDAATAETAFELERRIGGAWQLVATLPANAASYTDGALAAATTYAYRIRATDGALFSAYSNQASAATGDSARPLPGRSGRDLAALDANGDGAGDLAVLADGATNRVRLIDGLAGQEILAISYFSSAWLPVAIATLPDTNADAVANDPSIALLGHNPQTGKHTVQIRRASDGGLVRSIGFFGSSWQAIDVAVVDDGNGDGTPGDVAIAVLAFQPSTGRTSVQLRRAADSTLIRTVTYLNTSWTPIAVEALARPGAATVVAVLAAKSGGSGEIIVQSRRADDSTVAKNTYFFDAGWIAQDLSVVADPDGNAASSDAAFAVLASSPATGARQVEVRNAATGSLKKNLSILNANWRVIAGADVLSVNGNTRPEVGVLAENPVTGKMIVQLRDYGSAALVKNVAIVDAAKDESWVVRLTNSDDTATLILNGEIVGNCSGAAECGFDIGSQLLSGGNTLRIGIENASGVWAYGYEITRDGMAWAEDSCGVAESASCEESAATGTVLSLQLNIGY